MRLELRDIVVSYTRKTVLDGLSVEFTQGQIHAILGENGAGKSTAANVICGEVVPNSGQLLIDGKEVHLNGPGAAIQQGISYVHQRQMLSDSISVRENILLGMKCTPEKKRELQELMEELLPGISPKTLCRHIGSDMRFFTALCGALLKSPRLLILDEPTALLDEEQRIFLFKYLRSLALQGMNIIVITHRLEEARSFCDTICYLRDGRLLLTTDRPSEFTFPDEACPNSGQEPQNSEHRSPPAEKTEKPPLSGKGTEDLEIEYSIHECRPKDEPPVLKADFSANGGELLLIQGLPEDGLMTLENLITGMSQTGSRGFIRIKASGGERTIDLSKKKLSPRLLRHKLGIRTGIIPTDKKFRASNPALTITEVTTAVKKAHTAEELIRAAEINITPSEKAENLSGGMLQRLLVARELSENPELLILCQPMQGLDSAAALRTARKIQGAVQKGSIAIVLSSGDFPPEFATRRYTLNRGILSPDGEALE